MTPLTKGGRVVKVEPLDRHHHRKHREGHALQSIEHHVRSTMVLALGEHVHEGNQASGDLVSVSGVHIVVATTSRLNLVRPNNKFEGLVHVNSLLAFGCLQVLEQ